MIEARREWDDIFKVLKERKKSKNSRSATFALKNQEDIKTFTDKQKQSLLLAELLYKKY